jgi:dihydroorotase
VAVEAYLKVFAEEGALDKFEAFASLNGPAFYGFSPSETRVTYEERAWTAPESVSVENREIVPLFAGERVDWALNQRL